MPESSNNAYNTVPYPKSSHGTAHARRLEAIGTLFGMQPPPLTGCRVLELGCAAGWNLLPQAEAYPQSQFVGVDLSTSQINEAQSFVDTLGLSNVEFKQADLLDLDDSWGMFDYILCHGVFSWVPREIQNKILSICKQNLSPNGVALVSYNVLPGWNFRGTIRDMMLYHTAQFTDPAEQIQQARAVLDYMADNCSPETAYGKMLQDELAVVRNAEDAYLFHDHLEEHNDPIYFHQFVERAVSNELQYLGDIDFAGMLPGNLPKKAQSVLENASLVKQEQYMDFLRNNKFRQTLLCHQNVRLSRTLSSSILEKFHLSLTRRAEPFECDLNDPSELTVQIGPGKITTETPLGKAAITHLAQIWPNAITLDGLFDASRELLAGASAASDENLHREALAGAMIHAFSNGMLDISCHPPRSASHVSPQPMARPLTRLQALQSYHVTNARHEMVKLDDFNRHLISHLDAKHDHLALSASVRQAVRDGDLSDQATTHIPPEAMDTVVTRALHCLCQSALLEA